MTEYEKKMLKIVKQESLKYEVTLIVVFTLFIAGLMLAIPPIGGELLSGLVKLWETLWLNR